jgi:hypothetical protein
MKKGNKSTKGKKNWRKNIDTTEIDKKDIKFKEQQRVEKEISNLKDSELFEYDVEPIKGLKEKLLGNKSKREVSSKVEERIVKRMIKSELNKKEEEVNVKDEGLWDDERPAKQDIALSRHTDPLKFPNLPLPHPGQSYNPSKIDLTNLLVKVVEMNKTPEIVERLKKPTMVETKTFDSEDEPEELEKELKVSNNPPIDDYTQRRTKTQRNKAIKKRLNIIKGEQQRVRKQTKKQVLTVKGQKRFEKEKEKAVKLERENKLKILRNRREKEELIKIGVIEE